MRSRNLKPGFFTNADLLECDPLARILFSGLWCVADREGRLEDRPKQIKIQLLPCDNCDVDVLLQQLASKNLIVRYEVGGVRYIQITSFLKHQKPHMKESASTIPEPTKEGIETKEEIPKHQPRQVQAPIQAIADPASSLNPSSLNPSCIYPVSPPPGDAEVLKADKSFFEELWVIYPCRVSNGRSVKGGKEEAWQEYRKAIESGEVTHEKLMAEVQRYRDSPDVLGGKAMDCRRWLRNRRWNDELGEVKGANGINGTKKSKIDHIAQGIADARAQRERAASREVG
jgi:hypothetical protein